jgi:NADPH:quinone reductase-like Zn-dependent oxidoreductase
MGGIAGGVALFAFQFAVAIGAEVFVTSGSDSKIEQAIKLGARGGMNYTKDKWDKAFLSEYGKVDLIIDSAGGDGFDSLLSICNPLARIVMYGGTKGKASFLPRKLFWKELQIIGSTMGSDLEFKDMVSFVEQYKIKPVIDSVYSLEDHENAYGRMEKGEQFGKIVFRMD